MLKQRICEEPADKVELLQKIADTLQQAGDPELLWAAMGLRRYLGSKGACGIDACLGLKPRQGGQNETPWALHESIQRDLMIRDLVRLLPGSRTKKCNTLADWISAGGPPPTADVDTAEKYQDLMRAFPDIPKGARQLARIVKGETISARVTNKDSLTS